MVEDIVVLVAEEESIESTLEAALHQYLGMEVDGGEQLLPPPHLKRLIPLHASSLPATVWMDHGASTLIRPTSRAPNNLRRLGKRAQGSMQL